MENRQDKPMDAPPRILVVDDMRSIRQLIKTVLEPSFQVLDAESGHAALELLEQHQPELILLDVNMPEMDGYTLCRKIKQREATCETPVMFLSAKSTLDDRLQGFDAGGDDYLCKPLQVEELIRKVKLLLEWHKKQQQLTSRLNTATATAMLAMTNSSELGVIVNFIEQSLECDSYNALAHAILDVTEGFGLKGYIQMRTNGKDHNFSTDGHISPIIAELLHRSAQAATVVNADDSLFFNAPSISLMVSQLPNDPDKVGRLRDHLAFLIKSAEARVLALESLHHNQEWIAQAKSLLAESHQELQNAAALLERFKENSHQALTELTDRLDMKLHTLVDNPAIQSELMQVVEQGLGHLNTASQDSYEVQSYLQHLDGTVEKLINRL